MGNERRLEWLTRVLAGGLLLAIGMAIFGQGGAAAAPRAAAISVLGLLAVPALALTRFLPRPFRAKPGAVGWFLAGLLGLAGLGLWRTFYLHASLITFAVWAAAIAAYGVALVAGSRAGSNEVVRAGVILLGALAAAAWLVPPVARVLPGGGRTFVNANHLAALFATVLPVALAGVLFASRRPWGRLAAAAGGTSALLCATGLLVTGSRGGIIAAVVGLLCLALLAGRTRAGRTRPGRRAGVWAMAIAASAVVVAIQAGGQGFARFRPAEAGSESSMGFRLSIWNSSLNAAVDGGPLGWGPGTYGWVYPAYRRAGVPYRVNHAHNDWLEQSVEMGWAFPILGLGVAGALARRGFANCRAVSDRVAAGSAVAGMAGLSALGVHAMVDSPLQMPALLWLAAALAGLVSASGNIDRRAHFAAQPMPAGRLQRAVPALCATAAILVSIAPWREARAVAAMTRAGIAVEKLAMEDASFEARRAALRDPGSAEARATLGRILVGAREAGVGGRMALREAQRVFAEAVARNPRDADAQLDLARTAAKRTDHRAARAAYDRAVALDPVSGRIQEARARFLLRAGEIREALAGLRASVKADARGLSRALTLLWDETGDPDLLRAVTPENVPALIHLGDFLETKELFDAADGAFREAADRESGSATALLRAGRLALRRGRNEDAIAAGGAAWQQGRGVAEAGHVLAAALLKAGDRQRAAAVYEALLALDPGDARAARAVAEIGREIAQPQRGVAAWRGVTRARPADMDARLALARFYEAVGQPEDARREYQGILRFRPENSEARTALTRMQRSRKEGAS